MNQQQNPSNPKLATERVEPTTRRCSYDHHSEELKHLGSTYLCTCCVPSPRKAQILVRLAQNNLVAKPNYELVLNYLFFLLIPLSTNMHKSLV